MDLWPTSQAPGCRNPPQASGTQDGRLLNLHASYGFPRPVYPRPILVHKSISTSAPRTKGGEVVRLFRTVGGGLFSSSAETCTRGSIREQASASKAAHTPNRIALKRRARQSHLPQRASRARGAARRTSRTSRGRIEDPVGRERASLHLRPRTDLALPVSRLFHSTVAPAWTLFRPLVSSTARRADVLIQYTIFEKSPTGRSQIERYRRTDPTSERVTAFATVDITTHCTAAV